MKVTKFIIGLSIVASILMTGCASPLQPAISDLEDDKARVQHSKGVDMKEVQAQADYGCSLHGKTHATYISTSCSIMGKDGWGNDACKVWESLYACHE